MYEGYQHFIAAMNQALHQFIVGKGYARHVKPGESLEEQISYLIAYRNYPYALGQAIKKLDESSRLPYFEAINELRGAINFITLQICVMEDKYERLKSEASAKSQQVSPQKPEEVRESSGDGSGVRSGSEKDVPADEEKRDGGEATS